MSKKVYVDLSQQDVQDIINAYEKDIEKFNKQKEILDKIKEYLEEDDWTSVNGVIAVKLIKEKLNELLEEIE